MADRTRYGHYCSGSFSPSQSYTHDVIHHILNWRQLPGAVQPTWIQSTVYGERVSISECFPPESEFYYGHVHACPAHRDLMWYFFLFSIEALLKLAAHTTRKGISDDWITAILGRYRELFESKSADISISLGHLPTCVWYLAWRFCISIGSGHMPNRTRLFAIF